MFVLRLASHLRIFQSCGVGFYGKVNNGYIGFSMEKMENRSFVACDLKVGTYIQLIL